MYSNESAAKVYRNHRTIGARNPDDPCDQDCRLDMFCQTTSNSFDDWKHCMGKPMMDFSSRGDAITSLSMLLNYAWFEKK